MSKSFWKHFDLSFILLDDCFTNLQSQTDALLIHCRIFVVLQFTEALEELLQIFRLNATAWVSNVHDQILLNIVIGRMNLDVALFGKL